MAAVLRVKRKCNNSPLDTLVIACKRPKTEACLSDLPTVQTTAQFAGTLTDTTENITEHIAKILPKLNANNEKTGVKRASDTDFSAQPSAKMAKWINVGSVTKKYKITDWPSTSNEAESKAESDAKWMMLIDVKDSWSKSHMDNEEEEKEDIRDYVYDLYYAQTNDDIWFNNNILVQEPEFEDENYENEDKDDSSDSNAESYWKNDYPDTDPDGSDLSSDFEDDLYEEDWECKKFSRNDYFTRRDYKYVDCIEMEELNLSDSSF